MAYDRRFADFVRELLDGLGEIRIRPMFGGAGVFTGELMFALIFEDVLYLRADEANQAALVEAGARQFVYSSKSGDMAMAYWSLPDEAADDPEEAVTWARGSVEAAARKAATKRKRS